MSFDRDGLARAISEHGPVVRVVIAEVQGSVPRGVGTSMLVWASGQAGTIGGGALEYEATGRARDMLAAGEVRHLARAILGPDMGQCCGGAVTLVYERFQTVPELGTAFVRKVEEGTETAPDLPGPVLKDGWFIEPLAPPATPVWIWGAGHVGRAIAHVLAPLPGLAVTLLDTTADRFPDPVPRDVTARIAPDLPQALVDAPQDAHHIVLSYSHDLDLALCDSLLTKGFASAGLIGSATKWARFRSRLVQMGHDRGEIDRIRCPIGTPALGKDPATIAVGVAYTLLMELAKKEAASPVAG